MGTPKMANESKEHEIKGGPLTTTPKDVDEAFDFLKNANISEDEVQAVNLRRARSRVDWRIVPIMLCSYALFFIDKVLINYAAIMGLNVDLKLAGNDFSNVASTVSFAHLASSPLHALALNKLPASKYMAANIFLWGVTTAATAAATNYKTLLVTRVFLGIFESALAPCVTLLLSQWYTKEQQAPRFGAFFLGLGFGQITGGLLSYGFQHVTNSSLEGWRIMFLFAGALTMADGVLAWFLVPDSPMAAKFLSDTEKVAILRQTQTNLTGVVNRHFKAAHLWEMLRDFQIWVLTLMTILTCIPSGVISTYSATLIRGFGFTPKQAALLNLPSGVVAIIATTVAMSGIRYTHVRSPWVVACCTVGTIGACLLAFLPNSNRAGLLAGVYMISSVVPALPIAYQWVAANVAGHTKRPFSAALMSGAFGVGSIIGPQTFQARDAPAYLPARLTVIGVQAGGALCAMVLFVYYFFTNRRRNRLHGHPDDMSDSDVRQWENLTDKQNKAFRYVY